MIPKILVTGGLGYIGGRISKALAEKTDYELRIGSRKSIPENPSWLKKGQIVQMDLMSEDDLKSVCKDVKCIIHLAGMNEIDSAKDSEKAFLINSLGTLKLLHAAQQAKVERFVYFSTAHIYGAPLCGLITENTLPRPVHPYAITHHAAEDFICAAHDKKILTGIVVRLSNGFGCPISADVNRWTLVANDLCRQAVTTKKLTLNSSGLQQRDFITLEDVERAVIHLVDLPASKCENGIFNLGGESSMRIIDLTERVATRCKAVFGYTPPIIKPEPKLDEISQTLTYNIDKLKNTGFELKGSIDREIDATLFLCKEAF